MQKLLHTEIFTHRSFYTQKLLHTEDSTQKLLQTKAFTQRRFYTQTGLHRGAFTHRGVYAGKLLHAEAFTQSSFWHAADTVPLEGLPILRCSIYDPLERLQIFNNEACANGGIGFDFFEFLTFCTCCRIMGWGGCINVLDEHFLYVMEDA